MIIACLFTLEVEENRYIRYAYQLMLNDIENKRNCVNWASRVNFFVVFRFFMKFG